MRIVQEKNQLSSGSHAGSVAAWLRRVSSGLGEGAGGLTLHMRPHGGKRSERVKDFVVQPATNLDQLAGEIVGDAHTEANGVGNGTHAFTLYAYRGGAEDEGHFESKRFLISIEGAPDSGADDVDGQTLLAQSHRHMEAMTKLGLQERTAMWGAIHSMLDTVVSRLNHYETTEMQRATSVLEATKAQAMAINAMEDHKLDREIKKKATDAAFTFAEIAAPAIAKKFGLLPEPDPEPEDRGDDPRPPQIPSTIETKAPVVFDTVVVPEAIIEASETTKKKRSKKK